MYVMLSNWLIAVHTAVHTTAIDNDHLPIKAYDKKSYDRK